MKHATVSTDSMSLSSEKKHVQRSLGYSSGCGILVKYSVQNLI